MAFPDGRLLSATMARRRGGMLAVGLGLSLGSALWPVDYDRTALVAPHPLDVPGAERAETFVERRTCELSALPGRCGPRRSWCGLHRARGDEVRQMRWLVYAVVVGHRVAGRWRGRCGQPRAGSARPTADPVGGRDRDPQVPPLRHRPGDQQDDRDRCDGARDHRRLRGDRARRRRHRARRPRRAVVDHDRGGGGGVRAAAPTRSSVSPTALSMATGTTPYEALAQLSARVEDAPEELLAGIATTVANAVGCPARWWCGSAATDAVRCRRQRGRPRSMTRLGRCTSSTGRGGMSGR